MSFSKEVKKNLYPRYINIRIILSNKQFKVSITKKKTFKEKDQNMF